MCMYVYISDQLPDPVDMGFHFTMCKRVFIPVRICMGYMSTPYVRTCATPPRIARICEFLCHCALTGELPLQYLTLPAQFPVSYRQ